MNKRLPIVLLLACAAAFAFGVVQLFKLRFEVGDVYPEYSSLRTDPLGAMALYEGLERLPGLSVRRDHSAANQLPEGKNTTYLHLAARTSDWDWLPRETWKEIDAFLLNGGRLAITFFPEKTKPFRFLDDEEEHNSGKSKKRKKSADGKDTQAEKRQKKSKRAAGRMIALDSLKEHWGVELAFAKLQTDDGEAYAPAEVVNRSRLPLPAALDWHSATIFTNLHKSWRTLYARGTNPVVIERRFGSGTVVMATDSYFISNEAMRKDRHADLLAWLVGPNRNVLFDEAHHGIVETSGVATLIRNYRLHGLAAGLILLAGLFIWKNSVSLVPPHADEKPQPYVAGKGAGAGFVNLLRRNIPARDVLAACFAEWKKSSAQTRGRPGRWAKVQAVVDAENALPPRERDPARTYQTICRILKSGPDRMPINHE